MLPWSAGFGLAARSGTAVVTQVPWPEATRRRAQKSLQLPQQSLPQLPALTPLAWQPAMLSHALCGRFYFQTLLANHGQITEILARGPRFPLLTEAAPCPLISTPVAELLQTCVVMPPPSIGFKILDLWVGNTLGI